ncbi:MAG: hypothetical protein JRN68_05825 [Nitrososphaerota archaeon]|jgi:hypothetical protein|nr:hypothetical protein [Nitrososphaerota archaeon]
MCPEIQSQDRLVARILLLCGIAELKHSHISTKELAELLPDVSEEWLSENWSSINELGSRYRLSDGIVIPLSEERLVSDTNAREQSIKNISLALRFLSLSGTSDIYSAGISGSTSYFTPKPSDDVDLFCITATNGMWFFLFRALLLARFFRFLYSKEPEITLALTMDYKYASGEFSRRHDALFARDALQALQIYGRANYKSLLLKASWISRFYPKLYSDKLNKLAENEDSISFRSHTRGNTPLNLFLRLLLGNYIRLRSWSTDRRLAARGKSYARFRIRMNVDHLFYESIQYLKLRSMYFSLFSKDNQSPTEHLNPGQ